MTLSRDAMLGVDFPTLYFYDTQGFMALRKPNRKNLKDMKGASVCVQAGTTTELARERIHRHLERFWRLLEAIETGTSPPAEWLVAVQREDGLFPLRNAADWATPPPR